MRRFASSGWRRYALAFVVVGASLGVMGAQCAPTKEPVKEPPPEEPHGSATFSFTGAVQSFTVPEGVTAITIDAFGAEGGDGVANNFGFGNGGLGGRAKADVAVTPGETLDVIVGGHGGDALSGVSFGLGGTGGFANPGGQNGGGGGGASDVRRVGSRLVVAGGGGGGGGATSSGESGDGGAGGGIATNGTGVTDGGGGGLAGGAGSTGGAACGTNATPGFQGLGPNDQAPGIGAAGGSGSLRGGGAGGGGYFGGGGGGSVGIGCAGGGGGGGGGSGFGPPTGVTFQTGVRAGDGQVTITW
jgi:hypothetical protein